MNKIIADVGILPGGSTNLKKSVEKIGLIGAMDSEVSTLKKAAKIDKTTTIADMEFCEGTLEGKKVVIVKSGMGKVNASVCANMLINIFECTKVINTGVSGSLVNTLDIGDIVVSVDAVQHDFDVEVLGFAKGEIPYTGLYAFPADESLRSIAVEAVNVSSPGRHVFEGRICSGDQFIASKEQKDTIIANFGGMCCDMEGAAIAHECSLNHTPYVVIRAVSDKADNSGAVDFHKFEADAATACANIVIYMVNRI